MTVRFSSFAVRLAVLWAGCAGSTWAAAQTTWHVEAGVSGPGTGTAADPFARIDFALAQTAVVSGDVVLVGPGEYGLEQIDFGGKDVRVEATLGAAQTAIVGHGELQGGADPAPLVRFAGGEGPAAVLAGFTLRGTIEVEGQVSAPVVINGAAPSLVGCVFRDMAGAEAGDLAGALAVLNGGARIEDCRFEGVTQAVTASFAVLEVSGTTFEDCYGYALDSVSGDLELEDCEVLACGGGIGSSGSGAVLALDTHLVVADSLFDGAPGGLVGPRHIDASLGDCTLVNSTFVRGNTFTNEDEANGGSLQIQDSTLVVEGCSFQDNSADDGGSIFAEATELSVTNCAFEGSRGAFYKEGDGGAIRCSGSLHLADVSFRGCSATGGGAVSLVGATTSASLVGCLFEDNVASWEFFFLPDGRGGALQAGAIASLSIDSCEFRGNRATDTLTTFPGSGGRGGAIFAEVAASITATTFVDNVAESDFSSEGGALYATAACMLERCIFTGNRTQGAAGGSGAAIFNAPPTGLVSLERCTIDNGLGQVAATVRSTLRGCIVVGETTLGPESTAAESLVTGGWPGQGNLNADPLFWGPADYHLRPGSPAVDAAPSLGAVDPDGSLADMGALPLDVTYCVPGCQGEVGMSTCLSTPNSTGMVATCVALGSPEVSAGLLVLVARQAPPSEFGFFLVSLTSGFEPGFGGGMGNLCLGGVPTRLNGMPNGAVLESNLIGEASLVLDLAVDVPGGALPGTSAAFQYWFRDLAAGQTTSNTSSDVVVSFL